MTTYKGGCHCGKVRFEVDADIQGVLSCNCSMCSKTGALLSFVPAASFRLLSGEDSLSDYQFNKRIIHHLFCRECGIRSFSRASTPDGAEMVAINTRCLEDFDPSGVPVQQYDGKHA